MALSQSPSELERNDEEIRRAVRDRYAKAISQPRGSCCGSTSRQEASSRQGAASLAKYSPDELAILPADAVENSMGCGNPLAFAGVRPGDVVLDIGSGAGIDVLLASQIVGPTGKVIGLDMTPEMIERARLNAARAGVTNVEFRLGEAEHMPVADSSVDWIISNCVINLAPDKGKVFAEVYRVLKPGGRVSISDIVTGQLPEVVRNSLTLWASCIGGAIDESRYLEVMREAGLEDARVVTRQYYDEETVRRITSSDLCGSVDRGLLNQFLDLYRESVGQIWSAKITAQKPV